MPLNVVAKALEIRAFIKEQPERTYQDAAGRFRISRARISQMMNIVESLPADFITHMSKTQDRKTLNYFSGKTLLKIAAMPESAISNHISESRRRIQNET